MPCLLHFSVYGDFLLEIVQSDLNSWLPQDILTGILFCIVDCRTFLGEREPLCSWDTSGSIASSGPVSQRSLSDGATLSLTLRQLSKAVQK